MYLGYFWVFPTRNKSMKQIVLIIVCLAISVASALALFTETPGLVQFCLAVNVLVMGMSGVGGILHWYSQDQVDVRDIWRTKLEMARERIEVLEEQLKQRETQKEAA